MSPPMKALVYREYGEPEVLAVEERPRPSPGEREVVVKVSVAGVSIGDHHAVTGKPYLIRLSPFGGLPRPRNPVPGSAFSGTIEAVGSQVTGFRVGDEVFGQARAGAFAEYVAVSEAAIVQKPPALSFDDASAVPWAATALQALRDAGGVTPGQEVLIYGASGGVGTWAVQIGKALGATVTAVCSTPNAELVKALGADVVIDYTKTDVAQGGPRYDVMVDLVGNRSLSQCRSMLKPGGRYVACSGGGGDWVGPVVRIIWGLLSFMFSSQQFKTFVMAPKREDLQFLGELVGSGKVKPVIERRCQLHEVSQALVHVGSGHARGQTVVRMASVTE